MLRDQIMTSTWPWSCAPEVQSASCPQWWKFALLVVCLVCFRRQVQIFCPRRLIRNLNAVSTFAISQRSNFERDFFCVVKLNERKKGFRLRSFDYRWLSTKRDCGHLTIDDTRCCDVELTLTKLRSSQHVLIGILRTISYESSRFWFNTRIQRHTTAPCPDHRGMRRSVICWPLAWINVVHADLAWSIEIWSDS